MAHYFFFSRRFWVIKEDPSFRNRFSRKKVYLNTCIVARVPKSSLLLLLLLL